ncbi:MAG: Phosphoglucosamine mutase [Chlamydiia bacterium]|nr:Phosphoglucosamine mutase [Chlamydiia bacterium]MCH9616091.1 Phosphoglucosamine mutase [Chlamydiia bacterium]MCH9629486.1 Phosphoglucosamine mutase [Chlamydiia bacterium]
MGKEKGTQSDMLTQVKFKCTGCGKCCNGKDGYVWLEEDDITRLTKALGLEEDEFLEKYTTVFQGKRVLLDQEDTFDCIFLDENKQCSVYKARPNQCATFPFWPHVIESRLHWLREGIICEGINHPEAPLIPLGTIEKWKNFDPNMKREIEELHRQSLKDLEDAFDGTLHFGTGGMRTLMGPGTNRLNIYTIRMATQGLANVVKKGAVFISHDSRHHSKQFALEAARVLAGNNITVHLTPELRPTPFVSFGLRELKCQAGIMITASHNPPEYNGYKVYWEDGAQVVPPNDQNIIAEVKKIEDPLSVKLAPADSPLIHYTDETLDKAYYQAIKHPPIETDLSIVYSPLHGCGITMMPKTLEQAGFKNLTYVEEQKEPNGDFPTTRTPNPEERVALELGIRDMLERKADIFIASDPDADRLGVVVNHHGKEHLLTGNQTAIICVDYLCNQSLPENAAFVTTIVTTPLFETLVKANGHTCFNVLTGFKYIGEKIHQFEQKNDHTFIFGAEESYGYLIGTHSRDKDSQASAALICTIAAKAKAEGLTLVDKLNAIYDKYGLHTEGQKSIKFPPSKESMEKMAKIMQSLRENPPPETTAIDYENDQTGLPKSDVLSYTFKDQSKAIVRPSGTEPKIKIYGLAVGDQKRLDEILSLMEKHLKQLGA